MKKRRKPVINFIVMISGNERVERTLVDVYTTC